MGSRYIYIYIQNVQRGFRGTRVMPFFSFLVVFGLKAEWSMQPCWLRLIYIYRINLECIVDETATRSDPIWEPRPRGWLGRVWKLNNMCSATAWGTMGTTRTGCILPLAPWPLEDDDGRGTPPKTQARPATAGRVRFARSRIYL